MWIRVELHVALLRHALPAVDVPDALREVLPDVLKVHGLPVRVAGGGASTHATHWLPALEGCVCVCVCVCVWEGVAFS